MGTLTRWSQQSSSSKMIWNSVKQMQRADNSWLSWEMVWLLWVEPWETRLSVEQKQSTLVWIELLLELKTDSKGLLEPHHAVSLALLEPWASMHEERRWSERAYLITSRNS